MSTLFERITQLCKATGISIYKLEKDCEFSTNSIVKWCHSSPLLDRVIRVARYFDVSIDYLVGNTNNPKSHKGNDMKEIDPAFLEAFERFYGATNDFKKFLETEMQKSELKK